MRHKRATQRLPWDCQPAWYCPEGHAQQRPGDFLCLDRAHIREKCVCHLSKLILTDLCRVAVSFLQLEVTLGRIAMIGFVGLILNEAYFQRPFFPHLF
jgi:hypothetical protein